MSRTAIPQEPFSLDQYERYDLHAQLIDYAAKLAVEEGVINRKLLNKFGVTPNNGLHHSVEKITKEELEAEQRTFDNSQSSDAENDVFPSNLLHFAQQFRAAKTTEDKDKAFAELTQFAKLTPAEQVEISDLMTLLVPVINAANSVKEKEYPNATPEEIFKNFMMSGLKVVKDGKNTFGMRPEEWLEEVKATKSELILSFVNTSHPTNFHTPVGRDYEKSLITLMNTMKFDKDGIMNSDDLEGAFATQVSNACHDIKDRKNPKSLTYVNKITVGEETDTEKAALKVQKKAVSGMMQAWNIAMTDMDVLKEAAKVAPKLRSKVGELQLSETEKEKMYEQRSWILGGADKDGRDESTDPVFFAGYKSSLDSKGRYSGPIMDLRENAEIRKKLLNALMARSYGRNQDFRDICEEFDRVSVNKDPNFDHTKDGFLKMSEPRQQEFLEFLMSYQGEQFKSADKPMVVGLYNERSSRTEAVGFNEAYYKVLHGDPAKEGDVGFLKEHGLDKHTTYATMSNDIRAELLSKMSKVNGIVETGRDFNKPISKTAGYVIDRVHNDDGEVTGFTYYHGALGLPLTNSQPTPDGEGGTRMLKPEESLSCMSYLRRLYLVNHVIEEQKKLGTPNLVVEREQAANFENASDFFAQMYLYQQAGLVTVEQGKVTKAKIGIQPLFETTPEMLRGPEIIDKILASPLAESYYKTRGKAEFMVGYSDGAKSGGNFASHVRIREFERMLTKKFKDKFGQDYEVRILRGPGRGENRGGVRKYDRQFALHDDTVNTIPVSDQTLQGDLIIRMQMDPQFAIRTFAEIMVSAVAGTVKGRRAEEVAKQAEAGDKDSQLEVARKASFEKAIEFIAKHSEEEYRKGIYEKENECDAFIKTVVRNPEATSRRQKRANTVQKGIGPQRAITVEYATIISGVPMHDYGFAPAMDEFAKSGLSVLDRDGREVNGQKALEVLAQDSELFREELKLCSIRQQSMNPTTAAFWAKKAGQEPFINEILDNVSGLGDKCEQLLTGNAQAKARPREDFSGEPFMNGLSDVAQAILAGNDKVEKTTEQRLYFALQAAVSERPAGNMRVEKPGFSLSS